MTTIIDGRAIAEKVYAELRGEIAELKKRGRTPGLAVVLVGDNPASRAYVRSKDKMCRDLGLHSVKLELPADTTQDELLARVHDLNGDPAIHCILVQSPPPKQIDEAAILRAARLPALAHRKRNRDCRRPRCNSRAQHDCRKTAGPSPHAKGPRR